MKQRYVRATVIFFFLFSIAILLSGLIAFGQQPATPTGALGATSSPDMERRIFQLEVTQKQLIESLKSSNEYSRWLITGIGALIAILVAIQGFATASQMRLARERESHEAAREDRRDLIESKGVEQVSKVMNVVQQTLESRYLAEQEARKKEEDTTRKLKTISDFFERFRINIQKKRQDIGEAARKLAETPRHDFRGKAKDLSQFAQLFDAFQDESMPIEDPPGVFSPHVPYIRGIAAHYSNEPDLAKSFLSQVVGYHQPEDGEKQIDYDRRIANAYYFLGLIESNLGNNQNAIDSFEKANKLDPKVGDLLTRIATAEAYIMSCSFDRAEELITTVEDRLSEFEQKGGHLPSYHLRLRSRAALIRANMAIIRRKEDWHVEVQNLLNPVIVTDPNYYYATATLAQVNTVQSDSDTAQKLFREAYQAIERSDDLHTMTEARSSILLLMVTGMCCGHVPEHVGRRDEYLDRAGGLLDRLPKIGTQVCTVFSTLSKRNEGAEMIRNHIELIRKGKVFLEQD